MSPWLSFAISALALSVSAATAWLTFFRKGVLRMTQPTIVFFGPDGRQSDGKNKVFLRTLLYSTAKRGHVVESLHITLHRQETKQNFNIWVYGEKGELKRGGGIFVPQDGVTFDHHFLLPEDGSAFRFLAGVYRMTVYAKLVGATQSLELIGVKLTVSEAHGAELAKPHAGIYFDWGPDAQDYHPHIDYRPEKDTDPGHFFELLAKSPRVQKR